MPDQDIKKNQDYFCLDLDAEPFFLVNYSRGIKNPETQPHKGDTTMTPGEEVGRAHEISIELLEPMPKAWARKDEIRRFA